MKIGNRESLYLKTVEILYQAYFNDTMEHGNFCGCAVGNIIAANTGRTFRRTVEDSPLKVVWNEGGTAEGHFWYEVVSPSFHSTDADLTKGIEQIRATGYLVEEVVEIEAAFESAHVSVDLGKGTDEQMFNGLVAVLNVLAKIHDVQEDLESFPRFDAVYSSKKIQS